MIEKLNLDVKAHSDTSPFQTRSHYPIKDSNFSPNYESSYPARIRSIGHH